MITLSHIADNNISAHKATTESADRQMLNSIDLAIKQAQAIAPDTKGLDDLELFLVTTWESYPETQDRMPALIQDYKAVMKLLS